MNINEIKAELISAGAKEEDLAKVDFAKLESIFDGANNIEGLCKSLKEAYPTFDEAEFKKAIEENSKDSEEAQNLSDEDLAAVAGGSVGSWLNKNKSWLIPVAAVMVVGAGYGIFKYVKGSSAGAAGALPESNPSGGRYSLGKPQHDRLSVSYEYDTKMKRHSTGNMDSDGINLL